MAIYPPPVNILSVFDLNDYNNTQNNTAPAIVAPITPAYLAANYCQFPTCQGLLQTIPNGFVLNNAIVNSVSSLDTNTILAETTSDNCLMFDNKTSGTTTDFKLGEATTSGQSIIMGNATSKNEIASLSLLNNSITPITITDALRICNNQTSGNIYIGNGNTRSGNINIGSNGTAVKTISIGSTTSPLFLGEKSATSNTAITYNGKGKYSYAITITNNYIVGTNFPADGLIITNTAYLGGGNISITAGTSTVSFRSFYVQTYENNFYIALPATYAWAGLATGFPTSSYYLSNFGTYYFIIDDIAKKIVLAEGQNCGNRALEIPATTVFTVPSQRGYNVYASSIGPLTRGANGNVAFAQGPTSVILPYKGIYFLRLWFDCTNSNIGSYLTRVGMGVSILNNTDITYATALPYLNTYVDSNFANFKNAATKFTQVLTGYYVYNDTNPATIYPYISCGCYNNPTSTWVINLRYDIWLVG
jgi:hypothetical protein